MKKESSQTMAVYISSFCTVAEKLEESEIQIPVELLSIMILNLQPPKYENFCVVIESRDEIPSIESLKAKLIEKKARRLEYDNTHIISKDNNDALVAKNKNKLFKNTKSTTNQRDIKSKLKFTGKCFNCGKIGQ